MTLVGRSYFKCSARLPQRFYTKVRCFSMFAIFVTGGKQYKVAEGDEIFVEKLGVAEGEKVTFDKVLALGGEKLSIGTPCVEGATVVAEVLKNGKSKKIDVIKYKAKKNEKKKIGHRQDYTKVRIEKIEG